MKFGIRIPSLTRRIAARTSWKRMVRHNLGLKAPRGWGWLTNPRKAAYNQVYNRTIIGVGTGGNRVVWSRWCWLDSGGCGSGGRQVKIMRPEGHFGHTRRIACWCICWIL